MWIDTLEAAMSRVKVLASQAPVLRYYSLQNEVTIQRDESKNGLEVALLQNRQPVCYASHAMTTAESHYA